MRVAVIGSTGFIGSHAVRALESAGHDVLRIARSEPGGLDLGDVRALSERLRGVDAVVHAAGSASTTAPERVLGWLEVAGTENVLRAARNAGVRRFVVFSSTDANLGFAPRKNATENTTANPCASVFGRISKSKEEVAIASGTKRFEPVVLRAGFLYGAGERTRAPRFIEEARARGGIRIVGRPLSFVPTTNVANLASAACAAITAERAGHGVYHVLDSELSTQIALFGRYSIALGIDAPVRGSSILIERMRSRLGIGLDEGEVMRRGANSTLDARRAREELGYVAPAAFEDGMKALGEWVRESGGAEAVIASARRDPDETSIETIVRAAG